MSSAPDEAVFPFGRFPHTMTHVTQAYVRSVLEESLKDPLLFADRMRLRRSTEQDELIIQIADTRSGWIERAADPQGDLHRAALIAAYWRTMAVCKAQAFFISPTHHHRREAMRFLFRVVTQDAALQAVTAFPQAWRAQLGGDPQWCLRAPSSVEALMGCHAPRMSVVIEDAGSSDTQFRQLAWCAENTLVLGPDAVGVRLW